MSKQEKMINHYLLAQRKPYLSLYFDSYLSGWVHIEVASLDNYFTISLLYFIPSASIRVCKKKKASVKRNNRRISSQSQTSQLWQFSSGSQN